MILRRPVSCADIRKSLHHLDARPPDEEGRAGDVELTRAFFAWAIENGYDLAVALSKSRAWRGESPDRTEYIDRFASGEFDGYIRMQTWAEQMEE